MEKKLVLLVIAVLLGTGTLLLQPFPGEAASTSYGWILPSGKVDIYEGEAHVGTYSDEAILPEGRWLECEGDCLVRVWDMDFTAADQTRFAFATSGRDQILQVEAGRIHFSLFEPRGSISFDTPHGVFTVQQVIRKAAVSVQPLKGYLAVNGQQAEFGVLEGGTMVVAGEEGNMVVEPGQHLLAANTPSGSNGPAGNGAGPAGSGVTQGAAITGGAIGAAVGGVVIYDNNQDDDDNNGEVSPSTP